jgi:hypothetical protein
MTRPTTPEVGGAAHFLEALGDQVLMKDALGVNDGEASRN